MKKVLFCVFSLFCIGKAEAHGSHTRKHLENLHKKNEIKAHHVAIDKISNTKNWHQIGLASFYGPGFWGHKTSSGSRMKRGDMTAAHKSLPLGTIIKVTNDDNGKSVIVVINDRGPFVAHRIIDLAEKPAKLLDMKDTGTAHVSIEKLNNPDIPMEVASYEPRKPFKKKSNK